MKSSGARWVLAGLLALVAAPFAGPAHADEVGPLAVGDCGADTCFTTSTSHHTTFTRVDLVNADVFSTRIAVVVDGMVVFDQTVAGAPSSAAAQALQGQAAVVTAGACSVGGPFTSRADTVGPAVHVGDVVTGAQNTLTTTITLGPATIFAGEDGSFEFFVPEGSVNFNTNTHTETFVDQQFQATVTQATDLVFTAQSCLPGPPTNVTANLGSIVVSWTPPAYGGGTSAITSYVVTESPGGRTYTLDGSTTTLRIEDPAPGTYSFTVRAINGSGSSVESSRSNPVTVVAVGGAATPVAATPRFAG